MAEFRISDIFSVKKGNGKSIVNIMNLHIKIYPYFLAGYLFKL